MVVPLKLFLDGQRLEAELGAARSQRVDNSRDVVADQDESGKDSDNFGKKELVTFPPKNDRDLFGSQENIVSKFELRQILLKLLSKKRTALIYLVV